MRDINLNAISLTSLTPKEELSAMYKTIQSDLDLRLLYGEAPHSVSVPLS